MVACVCVGAIACVFGWVEAGVWGMVLAFLTVWTVEALAISICYQVWRTRHAECEADHPFAPSSRHVAHSADAV
jgi:hypothetical protein